MSLDPARQILRSEVGPRSGVSGIRARGGRLEFGQLNVLKAAKYYTLSLARPLSVLYDASEKADQAP